MAAALKIAMVAPDAWTLWLFYRQLIQALQRHGAQVTAYTAADATVPRLQALGVRHVAVPYARFIDPLADLRLLRALRRAFRAEAFDVVHNFTIKANLYGGWAAVSAAVPRIVNTVEGAGILYADTPPLALRALRVPVDLALRRLAPRVACYWFVNARDQALFVARGLALAQRSFVGIATGVDLRLFHEPSVPAADRAALRDELQLDPARPVVTLVAGRLLRSKGVTEFVAMASRLRAAGQPAQAVLVGPPEPGNPEALDLADIQAAVAAGDIRWIRFREDVWTVYALSDVVVVPTYYAEGTPKGVLEGMAMGRALVCSDLPTIRPLVTPGVDGLLVPPRDVEALTREVTALLADAPRRRRLGEAARRTALARFDADQVVRDGLQAVYGLAAQPQALAA